MKTYVLFFSICVICAICSEKALFAQAPQSFKYQAIARDGAGVVIQDQPVSFLISIISGSPTGTVVYQEEHWTGTNNFGLVTLTIGGGTVVSGDFTAISWGTAPHYIKIEMDPTGGTSYLVMGTTQLLSVPYALWAADGNQ
jgi:hypothetical protein